MTEETKHPLYGKPWTIKAKHKTYELAQSEIQQILNSEDNIQR